MIRPSAHPPTVIDSGRQLPSVTLIPTPHRYEETAGQPLGIQLFRVAADHGTDAGSCAVLTAALERGGARPLGAADPTGHRGELATPECKSRPVEIRVRTASAAGEEASTVSALPAGGYTLDVDVEAAVVTLHGVDAAGTWCAAQTFRQLVRPAEGGALVPAVHIRDWPQLPMRGVIEGFYGAAWSHQDRVRMLRSCGEHKMNVFVYAPKDDLYHRLRWREPYPPDELARLGELVTVARAQHVEFVYAIAPGLSIRHSDDADVAALMAKAQQLAGVGVRAFWLLFDDIEPSLRDPADIERFGDELSPPAAAQAHVANRFRREFHAARRFTEPLVLVPADYAGNAPNDYRRCLAERLDPDIPICWTGPDVVPETITAADVSAAAASFGRELVVWDNYPTNDFDASRLFLEPVRGRDREVCEPPVRGFVANGMVQAGPSRLPLLSVADFLWNPADYEPARSQRLALADFGGQAADALGILADACGSSLSNSVERAEAALVTAFWPRYDADPATAPYSCLLDHFGGLVAAVYTVAHDLPDDDFRRQSMPWLRTLGRSGRAASAALRTLAAQASGDHELAWQQAHRFQREARRLAELFPDVLRDVVDPFLRRAAAHLDVVTMTAREADDGALMLASVVRPGAAPVHHVEFLDGDDVVARADAGAATAWPSPPPGGHLLIARATRLDGSVVSSPPTWVGVGQARTAVVLVGDAAEASAGDLALRDRLARLGFAASVSATVPTGRSPDLVVVTAGARSDAVAAVRTMPVPVLACGALKELGLARSTDLLARSERARIEPAAGPIVGTLPAGPVTLYRGPGWLRWASVGEQATVGATIEGDPSRACTFGYPEGAAMPGLRAPARRAGTFLPAAGMRPGLVAPKGLDLFDAAVRWVSSLS